MARTALKEPQLKSWEAVNQTLADIAEARREIELEQAACNEQVDQLKTESKDKLKPLLELVKANELKLKEFCEARKSEFTQIKTKKLTHGSVG